MRAIRPDILDATIVAVVERGLATHPTEGRMANFLADLGLAAAPEVDLVRAAYFDRMAEGSAVMADAPETLAQLAGRFRLAIVTNGPSELQRRKIERFGLAERVDWIVISGEVGVEKPDRAIFDHVRGLTGVAAERTAHIGDSLVTDVAGANAAGVLSIWVRNALVRSVPDRAALVPHATIGHVRELVE